MPAILQETIHVAMAVSLSPSGKGRQPSQPAMSHPETEASEKKHLQRSQVMMTTQCRPVIYLGTRKAPTAAASEGTKLCNLPIRALCARGELYE